MTRWLWIGLVSNLAYGIAFLGLLRRRRWTGFGLAVGVVHLLIAAFFSVAPLRSAIDPDYPGLAFGVLRFEGRAAVLPAGVMLAWSLACAYLAAAGTSGRAMWAVAIFDLLLAANLAAGMLSPGSGHEIQFGEHLTIPSGPGLAIMLALFVAGPLASAVWSARRARRAAA